MQDALRPCDEGVILDVDVTPSADEDLFPAGYNHWRERVEARVAAPARDGEANRALSRLVARVLDIDPRRIAIGRGRASSRKSLLVQGADVAEIEGILRSVTQG